MYEVGYEAVDGKYELVFQAKKLPCGWDRRLVVLKT